MMIQCIIIFDDPMHHDWDDDQMHHNCDDDQIENDDIMIVMMMQWITIFYDDPMHHDF